MLGSTGALFTDVWNTVSEAQPSSLDRLGRSIGPTNVRHSAVAPWLTTAGGPWNTVRLGRIVSSISFSRNAALLPEAQAPQPDHNVHDGYRSAGDKVQAWATDDPDDDDLTYIQVSHCAGLVHSTRHG